MNHVSENGRIEEDDNGNSITIDNGTEDGLDLEEISYPYYDDNLNLVDCTLN